MRKYILSWMVCYGLLCGSGFAQTKILSSASKLAKAGGTMEAGAIINGNGGAYSNGAYMSTGTGIFVRVESDEMGIGTNGPSAILDVVAWDSTDLLNISSGTTERVTVLANGNVGIGTNAPARELHLYGGSGAGGLLIETDTSVGSDPSIEFLVTGVKNYVLGIDNSNNDQFKISRGGAIGANEAFVIDSLGRIGLGGEIAPERELHITKVATSTGTGAVIRLERNDAGVEADEVYAGIEFYGNDSSGNASGVRADILAISEGTQGEAALAFSTAANNGPKAERMRIDSSGNTGFGTNTPSAKLDVNGNAIIRGTNFFFYVSSTNWAGTWADYTAVYHGVNSNGTIRTLTNAWGW